MVTFIKILDPANPKFNIAYDINVQSTMLPYLQVTSVADQDSLNLDPAFQVNPDPVRFRIRIQGFDDQKLKKKTVENLFLNLFLVKNGNLLIPMP
jgi:hypothetical protein